MKLRAGAVAALLAASLVGCGGDEPTPPPDSSTMSGLATPTTPTDEPSETEPDKPLGPVATVRAWVKALNQTIATGDTTDVYELSSRDCDTCSYEIDPIAETHEDGGRYEASEWIVQGVGKSEDWQSDHTVQLAVEFAAGRAWVSKGAEPTAYESEKHVISFEMGREGGRWLVKRLVYLS